MNYQETLAALGANPAARASIPEWTENIFLTRAAGYVFASVKGSLSHWAPNAHHLSRTDWVVDAGEFALPADEQCGRANG